MKSRWAASQGDRIKKSPQRTPFVAKPGDQHRLRTVCWGLAAFGQEGVERVLDLLRAELLTVMRQTGTPRLNQIDRSFIVDSRRG